MSDTLTGVVVSSGTDLDALTKQIEESGNRIPGHVSSDTPIPPPPGFEVQSKPALDINPAFAGALKVQPAAEDAENAQLLEQAKAASEEGYLSPEESQQWLDKAAERVAAEEQVSDEDVAQILGDENAESSVEISSPLMEPSGEIDLISGGSMIPESAPITELPAGIPDTEGPAQTVMGEKLAEALKAGVFHTAEEVPEVDFGSSSVQTSGETAQQENELSTKELTEGKLEYAAPEILAETRFEQDQSEPAAVLQGTPESVAAAFTPEEPAQPFEPIAPMMANKPPFVRRVDAKTMPNKGVVQEKDIFNRTLEFVLKDFFKTAHIDDEIRIQGTFVKNSKTEGIWDEGGATSSSGHVVTATDPEGKPLIPVFVYQSKGVVNGRHALVQVWPKCYIIFGGHRYGKAVLGVYRIEDVAPVTNENQKYPKFLCKLVAVMTERSWQSLDVSETRWTREHPAVKAAYDRIFEINASTPAFVADYREQRFDPEDFGSCIQDKEFLECLESFDSLPDMYDYISSELGYHIGQGLSKNQHPLAITSLNYFKEQNTIAIFMFGVLYDVTARSSKENRIAYARVLLKPGDSFFYIDRDESSAISYEDLCNTLTRNGGAMATSFRRMTEYK